jgi:hypothetical protein
MKFVSAQKTTKSKNQQGKPSLSTIFAPLDWSTPWGVFQRDWPEN